MTPEDRTVAPWTHEQVESLNAYQRSGVFHPFTCPLRPDHPWLSETVLVATRVGWMCPKCTYTQDWAPTWMADGHWRQAPIPDALDPPRAMVETVVYGASDDLIEIEGGIREEFVAYTDDDGILGFSDGTVLRIVYTDTGVWRIMPVAVNWKNVRIEQAPEGDEENYSDRAYVKGVSWVVYGTQMAGVSG